MTDYLRDALLATASGGVFFGALALTDSLASLRDPAAVAAGIAVALVVEAAFVSGTAAADLWKRPAVHLLSTAGLVGGAAALAWATGPWVLAAACWGLATYYALLVPVVTGVWSDGR